MKQSCLYNELFAYAALQFLCKSDAYWWEILLWLDILINAKVFHLRNIVWVLATWQPCENEQHFQLSEFN